MFADVEWVERKYRELSPLFGGRLPQISVKLTKRVEQFGSATCTFYVTRDNRIATKDYVLRISNAYDSPEEIKINILLHEMIHLYDYYNFPQHFARVIGPGELREIKYDAHGEKVFIPMMDMLNSKGYNVSKYVNDNDMATMTMSDDVKKRMEKPFMLCYAVYAKATQKNMLFICSPKTLDNIRERYSTPEWNRFAPECIYVYKTSNPTLKKSLGMTVGNSVRGYGIDDDKWDGLLVELGLSGKEPDETITFKKNEMNEGKRTIRLTESELRQMVSEAVMEALSETEQEPVDGGRPVGKRISPSEITIATV